MGTLKTRIEKSIKDDIEYYKKIIENDRKRLKNKKTFALAEKLESAFLFAGECEVYPTTWGSLTIKFNKHEDAREFIEKVMDKLGLNKIERQMEQYNTKPVWFYHINPKIDDESFYLSVYPAQPVEDCIPMKEYESREPRERWVCRPKYVGGER